MKNIYTLLAATTLMSLATTAYANDPAAKNKSSIDYKDNGGYEAERSSERTNASGTKQSSEYNVDVDVDDDGRVSRTIENVKTTDPKGLMNQKQESVKTQIKERDRGGYTQTTVSKHRDANGTDTTYVTTTDLEVDSKGNVTTVAKTEKTVDPKGLMNSTTTTTRTKTVNGKVVEQDKKIDN